jgi:hypothetical protein
MRDLIKWAKCGTVQPPTKAEIRASVEADIREAVREGWLRDSGRRRNGEIVWIRGDVRPPWLDDEPN